MAVLSRLNTVVQEMTLKLDVLREMRNPDWVVEMAILHALQLQAQALLDMVRRLASELGYTPSTLREALRVLLAEGVISDEEYSFVLRVAGFRNIVVHEYADVDMELVYRILGKREYRRVAVLASKLLAEARGRGLDP